MALQFSYPEQIGLKLPARGDLSLFSLALSEEAKSGHLSLHAAQTTILREIAVDSKWECLTGPSFEPGRIFLISQKSFMDEQLNALLEKFQLTVAVASATLTWEIYLKCLHFTMSVKLAPEWNKIGNGFIQGRNFLRSYHQSATNAIEMEVSLRSNFTTYLSVNVFTVILPTVQLHNLGIDRFGIAQFQGNSGWTIEIQKIKKRWCRVLPTLNKGEIVGVKRQFGKDSVFKSYEDMRVYWQKMYGLILPTTEDCPDLFFYDVVFCNIGPNPFTYPSFCVCTATEEKRPSRDKAAVIRQFLTDVVIKIPTICGKKLELDGNADCMPSFDDVAGRMLVRSPLAERKVKNLEDYGYKRSFKRPGEQPQKTEMEPTKAKISKMAVEPNVPVGQIGQKMFSVQSGSGVASVPIGSKLSSGVPLKRQMFNDKFVSKIIPPQIESNLFSRPSEPQQFNNEQSESGVPSGQMGSKMSSGSVERQKVNGQSGSKMSIPAVIGSDTFSRAVGLQQPNGRNGSEMPVVERSEANVVSSQIGSNMFSRPSGLRVSNRQSGSEVPSVQMGSKMFIPPAMVESKIQSGTDVVVKEKSLAFPLRFPFPVVKRAKFQYPSPVGRPSLADHLAVRQAATEGGKSLPPPWADKLDITAKRHPEV